MTPPSAFPSVGAWPRSGAVMKGEESEDSEDELGDEEDITAQPLPEEESSFDDFDDEFDSWHSESSLNNTDIISAYWSSQSSNRVPLNLSTPATSTPPP
jgi:hypothetical protein